MSVQMPVPSGLDAMRQIGLESRKRDTPIIATTANAFGQDTVACRAAAIDDHVPTRIEPNVPFESEPSMPCAGPAGIGSG